MTLTKILSLIFFYRKAWDVGIDYRIIASEKISFAERYKVHFIEKSQVAEPLTLRSKFSAYRKALLKKLGLKNLQLFNFPSHLRIGK